MDVKQRLSLILMCTVLALIFFAIYQEFKYPDPVKFIYKPFFAMGYTFTWVGIVAAMGPVFRWLTHGSVRRRANVGLLPLLASFGFYFIAHGLSTPEWLDRVVMAWGGCCAVLYPLCFLDAVLCDDDE